MPASVHTVSAAIEATPVAQVVLGACVGCVCVCAGMQVSVLFRVCVVVV